MITEVRAAQGMSLPSNPVTRKYLAEGENAYTDLKGSTAITDTDKTENTDKAESTDKPENTGKNTVKVTSARTMARRFRTIL